MLSPKPWKLETMMRLMLSLMLCYFVGILTLCLTHFISAHGRPTLKLCLLFAGAVVLLGTAMVRVWTSFTFEKALLHLATLWVSLLLGFLLAAWVTKITGLPPPTPSFTQTIIGVVSLQGATLVLMIPVLRQNRISWNDAFGFSANPLRASLLGITIGSIFTPLGYTIKAWCIWVITHLPVLHLQPEEQVPVQVLQTASSTMEIVALGVITILIAPMAEEILFRGILYPWIRQAGFPRVALWGTSLLFAAIHGNMAAFLPLLILAVVLAILYEQTNNLLAPILAHSLFNVLGFVGAYVSEKVFPILLLSLIIVVTCLFLLLRNRVASSDGV
ncbi:MAG: hypothetical protein C5B50_10775 [Verrucomicrobia bacterium]|nr:MAG: hypothetical protein C5B50_10775 [Verrucomicrobiota bacterium]